MTEQFRGYVKRGLIQVPVFAEAPPEPPDLDGLGPIERMIAEIEWTPQSLRNAHAAYERGNRNVYVVAGHREYDRRRKAEAKGRLNDEDRRWAEKAAREGFWRRFEQVNRTSDASAMLKEAFRML